MTQPTDNELTALYYDRPQAHSRPLHAAKLRAVWEAAQQALLDDWLPADNQILARLNLVVEVEPGNLEESSYEYIVEREPTIEAHTLTPHILEWLANGGDEDLWPDTIHSIGHALGEIVATYADSQWYESVQRDGV